MDNSNIPLNSEAMGIATRTLLAQSRIDYLERYIRLVGHGLILLKEGTRWFNFSKRLTNFIYFQAHTKVTKPRVASIIKQYRLSMSAPFAQPFNQAEQMFKEFCNDHKTSIANYNSKHSKTDMMEM